jgi:hypothetical protein
MFRHMSRKAFLNPAFSLVVAFCLLLSGVLLVPQVSRVLAVDDITVSNVKFVPSTGRISFDYTGTDVSGNNKSFRIDNTALSTTYWQSVKDKGNCNASSCHGEVGALISSDAGVTSVKIVVDDTYSSQSVNYPFQLPPDNTPQNPEVDGWTAAGTTWTYASPTTLTASGDVTAVYQKGTKIKLTQTTAKYFYVIGSSHSAGTTTVTVTGGTDYSLANAAITNPFYSYLDNPQGFPDEFSFTPTATSDTGSAGTYAQDNATGEFSIKGKLVYFRLNFRITNKGSWNGAFWVSSPVTGGSQGFTPLTGYVAGQGNNPATASRGVPYYYSAVSPNAFGFTNGAGTNSLGWISIAANDWVALQGYYPL